MCRKWQIIYGEGKCEGVVLTVQGVEIVDEFLLFELGSTDVILGYSWLETLGNTKVNWKLHTLSFKVHQEWVTLVGDSELLKEQISLKSMELKLKGVEIVCLLELSTLFEGKEPENTEPLGVEFTSLLGKYNDVFQMPKGLPP